MDDNEGTRVLKPQDGKTLAELLKTQTKDTWSKFDPRLFTKDDYKMIGHDHPMGRLTDLLNSAPDRELVSQLAGRVEVLLKSLVQSKLLQPMGRAAFKASFGRPQSHSKRIEIARQSGLIDLDMVKVLTCLAFVRNEFGHDPELHFFEHSQEVALAIRKIPIKFEGAPFQMPLRTLFFSHALGPLTQLEAKLSHPHTIFNVPEQHTRDYSWRWT